MGILVSGFAPDTRLFREVKAQTKGDQGRRG
jgi:hypothetical protein